MVHQLVKRNGTTQRPNVSSVSSECIPIKTRNDDDDDDGTGELGRVSVHDGSKKGCEGHALLFN